MGSYCTHYNNNSMLPLWFNTEDISISNDMLSLWVHNEDITLNNYILSLWVHTVDITINNNMFSLLVYMGLTVVIFAEKILIDSQHSFYHSNYTAGWRYSRTLILNFND